jgi:O-antigen/teichoic acid export membrane protein
MGIAMSLRFPTDLCHGGLLGLQKQVISNAIVAGAGSIRGLGSIIVLCYFAPTIEVFFAWQILVNFFEAVLVSRVLKAYVNPNHEIAKFRTNVLRSTWKYAAGMTGISLISIVLSEVDKIVVCSILTLESFGIYSIATILSRAPSTIGSPIADAIFPKLTQLVSKDDTVGVIKLYHLACQLVSVVSIPTGIVIAIFSQELITIWTQNSQIGIEGRYTTSVLVIGTVCLSIMIVPFRLALAHGWTSLNFIIGVFSIIIVLPLVTALTLLLGNLGAAIGWLALNLGMLAPFVIILHNRILPGQTITWFICDTGLPLIASLVSIGLARFLYIETLIQVFQLTEIAIAWLMGVVTSMLAAPMVRILLIEQYQMRIMRFRKRKQ